jgi:hypothetical protein
MGVKHIKLDDDLLSFCETRMIAQERYLLRLERELNELQRKIIMARAEIIGIHVVAVERKAELMENNDE